MPRRLRYGVSATALILMFSLWLVPSSLVAATPLPNNCAVNRPIVNCGFAYNGTTGVDGNAQAFVVPPGVTSITVEAWGAQGGGAFGGGLGGHVRGTLTVTPRDVLWVRVGGQPMGSAGGFNGGGNGSSGGGGASDVRRANDALADRIFVAGGGGASGNTVHAGPAGVGGGMSGGAPLLGGAFGGTQTTGGAGGASSCAPVFPTLAAVPGGNGTTGSGGDGGIVRCQLNSAIISQTEGAGGGGGLFGGGGGGAGIACVFTLCPLAVGASAGGGSGFTVASATNVVNESGIRAGNGLVDISYVNTPPHKDACKNNGWSDYVDNHGNAFSNQGQCVAWTEHHL